MPVLSASVGQGGRNQKADVLRVQGLLNQAGARPSLRADGRCGKKTIAAIRKFQRGFMRRADGRVDPGGRTLRELGRAAVAAEAGTAPDTRHPPSYWRGDPKRWQRKKKLASLEPEFRAKVEAMLAELEAAGFQPKIFYAWRSVAIQRELKRKGRSKVDFSFHNAQLPDGTPRALAVDIVDKRWGWGELAKTRGFWSALGAAAHDQELYWGGSWRSFKDWAHVQALPNRALARVKRESGLA